MHKMQASRCNDVHLVLSRLRDFFGRSTPWHRRLWNTGTTLSLREVLECADDCLDRQVPRTTGLQFAIERTRSKVQLDPGVSHLAEQLDSTLSQLDVNDVKEVPRVANDELGELVRRAEEEYCSRWRSAPTDIPVEFAARAIASYLLDSGFSSDHLFRWLQAREVSFTTIHELAEETDGMVSDMQAKEFQVFVPCTAPYVEQQGDPGTMQWMDGHKSAAWLAETFPDEQVRRQNGGFLLVVQERDPWSAIEAARSLIARADARAKVAQPSAHTAIRLDGWARVVGNRKEFTVHHAPRLVKIGSLHRNRSVYRFDGGLPSTTDDALELASYMESPNAGAAITGGWAAVEALLIRPGERQNHLAADRLASLVACSLPRAELTPLAYKHMENAADELSDALRRVPSNYERIKLVEEHLYSGQHLTLTDGSDLAAEDRIIAILNDPSEHLDRIRGYVTESLRRLYYQRNRIAHAGSFRSVALSATVRTSFCLVGAGLDRIVHEQLVTDGSITPLKLVARAETELRLVGTEGGRSPTSLLD